MDTKWPATMREAIEHAVASGFETTLADLSALCRIPTLSRDATQLALGADLLESWLVDLGFTTRRFEIGSEPAVPLLFAERRHPAAVGTLLIYAHYDVQPPGDPAEWHSPAFAPEVRDGVLFGRGSNDPKGQMICQIAALRALREAGLEPALNIKFILDPQEEIGSPDLEAFVVAHKDLFTADLCFMADGESVSGTRPTMVFGNRGLLHILVSARTGLRDVHSGIFGGVMPNAAWRIVHFLARLMDEDGTIRLPGFHDPVLPVGDAERAALAKLPLDRHEIEGLLGIALPEGLSDEAYWSRIMYTPTCDITGLVAGYTAPGVKAQIPANATAKLGLRLVADQDPDAVLEAIRRFAKDAGYGDLSIEIGAVFRPLRTPFSSPEADVIRGAVRDAFGVAPLTVPVNGGSNPNPIWMNVVGVPPIEVSYCHQGGQAHGPDEHMLLDRIRCGSVASALVFARLAKHLETKLP
jgi:acetylornithine deacetylase/succinyl-diaminopimelate desuccinylase-like protein